MQRSCRQLRIAVCFAVLKIEDLNQGGWIFAWPQCQWKYIYVYICYIMQTYIYIYIMIRYNDYIWLRIYIYIYCNKRWYTYNILYNIYIYNIHIFDMNSKIYDSMILCNKMPPNHSETRSRCVAEASLNSQTFHAPLCRPFLSPKHWPRLRMIRPMVNVDIRIDVQIRTRGTQSVGGVRSGTIGEHARVQLSDPQKGLHLSWFWAEVTVDVCGRVGASDKETVDF